MTQEALCALCFHIFLASAGDLTEQTTPATETHVSSDNTTQESKKEVLELLEKLKIGDNSKKK